MRSILRILEVAIFMKKGGPFSQGLNTLKTGSTFFWVRSISDNPHILQISHFLIFMPYVCTLMYICVDNPAGPGGEVVGAT